LLRKNYSLWSWLLLRSAESSKLDSALTYRKKSRYRFTQIFYSLRELYPYLVPHLLAQGHPR
jgi:hypothetical protein